MKKIFFLLSFAGVVGLLGFLVGSTPFSNHRWLSKEHEDQKRRDFVFNEFLKGEDFVLAVRLNGPYFSRTFLDQLNDFVEELKEVKWVQKVESPLHSTVIVQKDENMNIQTFHEGLENKTIESMEEYRKRLRKSDYYGRLISKDEKSIAIVAHLELSLKPEEDVHRREYLLGEVRGILPKYPALSRNHFTGSVFLYHQMDQVSRSNLFFFLPLALLLVFVFLYGFFGQFIKVLLVIASACYALLAAFLTFFFFKHPLTVISVTLPMLVLVIAVADAIHILARWEIYYKEGSPPLLTLKKVFKEIWLPCLFTSLTTAIGFGSFYLSELVPLKHFGQDSFFGIVFAYGMIILSMAWGLYIFTPAPKSQAQAQAQACA